jgi:pullulanase/glycogen debranching enzyme
VVDQAFDWQDDRPPAVPWEETVIYEAHVKGLTIGHPDLPVGLRGTYLGLAHPAVVEHLRSLHVTALELMPVQQFITERQLVERGLTNYWVTTHLRGSLRMPPTSHPGTATRSPNSRRRWPRSTEPASR